MGALLTKTEKAQLDSRLAQIRSPVLRVLYLLFRAWTHPQRVCGCGRRR